MEAQLKAMRVPELKELATKVGIPAPARVTKDKIIALLLESPDLASVLDGSSSDAAAAPASDPSEPAAKPPVAAAAPSKPGVDALLAPPKAAAPTGPIAATDPAHVAKPVKVDDPSPAASNAYGSTAVSAAATSESVPPTTAEPDTSSSTQTNTIPVEEIEITPLEGSSKPIAGITELTDEEKKKEQRKTRFEREWQIDQVRKDAEAAAKATRDEARSKEVAAKQTAPASAQVPAKTPTAAASPKTANGTNGHGLSAELIEKRKAKFAQASDQVKPSVAPTPKALPVQPPPPVLSGVDAAKAAQRKNKFTSLLPGQPGYKDQQKEPEASPKRKREEDVDEPVAKKAKTDGLTT